MKPTDKEYIDLASEAKIKDMFIDAETGEFKRSTIGADGIQFGIKTGYQLALEHTNHAELVEALKEAHKKLWLDVDYHDSLLCKKIQDALTKSETSKL